MNTEFVRSGEAVMKAPGNELWAELFQGSHRIEKWGRGIIMILEREPATEFEEVGSVQFVVTVKRKAVEKVFTEDSRRTSVISSVKIQEAIAEKNRITIPELAELAGVPERSIERNIQQLQKTKRLRRIGPDKGGYWEINH